MPQPRCDCFGTHNHPGRKEVYLHAELQDTQCDAWKRLTEAVEKAADDQLEVFTRLAEIKLEEWDRIITFPPIIRKLKSVRHLNLYGSHLVRVPREIGGMTGLVEFTPYTSWRLHWFLSAPEAFGRKAVSMGVRLQERAEGLRDTNDAGSSVFVARGFAHELLDGLLSESCELGE